MIETRVAPSPPIAKILSRTRNVMSVSQVSFSSASGRASAIRRTSSNVVIAAARASLEHRPVVVAVAELAIEPDRVRRSPRLTFRIIRSTPCSAAQRLECRDQLPADPASAEAIDDGHAELGRRGRVGS